MMIRTVLAMALLALDISAQSHVVNTKNIDLINWFEINEYITTDSMRLVTKSGNIYVYDKQDKAWKRSAVLYGEKVSRVEWSDSYEFYSPMYNLRIVATGEVIDLSNQVPANDGTVRAVFNDDLIAMIGIRDIVLYDINTREVRWKKTGIRGYSRYCPFFMTDSLLYLLDGGYAYIYDIASGEVMDEFRVGSDNTFITARQSSPHYNNILLAPSLNTVVGVDRVTNDVRVLYSKDRHEGHVRSMYVHKDEVFTSWHANDSITYIEKTNIDNGTHELVCVVPSYAFNEMGTGKESCIIEKVDDNEIWLSDVFGGLYRYDLNRQKLEWSGYGIYEFKVRLVADKEDALLLSGKWLSILKKKDTTIILGRHTLSLVAQSYFRNQLVVLDNAGGLYWIGLRNETYQGIIYDALSYFTKNDTTVYVSNRDAVYEYNGMLRQLYECDSCTIIDGEGFMFAKDRSGRLYKYAYSKEEIQIVPTIANTAEELVCAVHNGEILVTKRNTSVSGYEIASGTELWSIPYQQVYEKKATLSGIEILVLANGMIIDPANGSVLRQMKDGIISSGCMMDTCYLFYEDGSTIQSWIEAGTYVHKPEENWKQDIRIFPNPSSSWVTLSWNTSISHFTQFRVIDQLGRVVHTKEIQLGSTSATWNASNAIPGIYFIQIMHEKGIETGKVMVR